MRHKVSNNFVLIALLGLFMLAAVVYSFSSWQSTSDSSTTSLVTVDGAPTQQHNQVEEVPAMSEGEMDLIDNNPVEEAMQEQTDSFMVYK
jgi:hypothetical protein